MAPAGAGVAAWRMICAGDCARLGTTAKTPSESAATKSGKILDPISTASPAGVNSCEPDRLGQRRQFLVDLRLVIRQLDLLGLHLFHQRLNLRVFIRDRRLPRHRCGDKGERAQKNKIFHKEGCRRNNKASHVPFALAEPPRRPRPARGAEFACGGEVSWYPLPMAGPGMFQSQNLSLQQVLAPQLQQSLLILQAPLLELRNLVQQEMETNPVLEELAEPTDEERQASDTEPAEDNFKEEFDQLAKLDDEWRDYMAQSGSYIARSQEAEDNRRFFFDSIATQETLQQHLMGQLNQSPLNG